MKQFSKLFFIFVVCCMCVLCVTSCKKKSNIPVAFQDKMGTSKEPESEPDLPRNERNLETIDLTHAFDNPGMLDFGNNVKDYHLIFLETNKDCLIGEIRKVTISDSMIFVLDIYVSNALFMFRYDGSFVRCIGRKGRGPGEYLQATDYYVDSKKGVVTIYDHFNASFLDYSIKDGHYIKTRKVVFRLSQFTKLGEHYIYEANTAENSHMPSIKNRAMLVGTDEKPIEFASLKKNDLAYRANKLMKIDNATASISIPFVDTIYYTDGTSIHPRFYLKFNNKTRLPDNYKDLSKSDYDIFRELFPQSRYTIFNGDYSETLTHLFFSIYYKKDFYYFYYNKKSHQLLSGTPGKYPDPEPVSPMSFFVDIPPISSYGDMFIGVKNPETVLSALQKKYNIPNDTAVKNQYTDAYVIHEKRYPQLKNVDFDDNPILVLFSLK